MSARSDDCPAEMAERVVLTAAPMTRAPERDRLVDCPRCGLTCLPTAGVIPPHPDRTTSQPCDGQP